MRIVGGALKGRKLASPRGAGTRPTAGKVREALFDILGERVRGVDFLDLFAGTGAVGLEALSRGARRAVLVERSAGTFRILEENAARTGLEERCRLLRVPAAKALSILAGEGWRFAVVFFDPPYADPGWPGLLVRLAQTPCWEEGGLLVVEAAAGRALEVPPGFEAGRSYRYGDTALHVFRKAEER
ncbi:MAG: 16S rRNA (guanine(966)-N(2))-methyltransferase RsmD [Acidobacteriota bacterium]